MHIGSRIFPYPVLNRDPELSDYVPESVFRLEFDTDGNGAPITQNETGDVVFRSIRYTVTDASLNGLIKQGRVKGAFILECSGTVFRKRFDISDKPCDLRVPMEKINGKAAASCYLYAAEDIADFRSGGFIPEYAGYSFDIDKFDILAVDDGFTFRIDHDPSGDERIASIFSIIKKEGGGDIMTYANGDKDIVIYLPEEYFNSYENIKKRKECNNAAFAMLAIPVLASCIGQGNSIYFFLKK